MFIRPTSLALSRSQRLASPLFASTCIRTRESPRIIEINCASPRLFFHSRAYRRQPLFGAKEWLMFSIVELILGENINVLCLPRRRLSSRSLFFLFRKSASCTSVTSWQCNFSALCRTKAAYTRLKKLMMFAVYAHWAYITFSCFNASSVSHVIRSFSNEISVNSSGIHIRFSRNIQLVLLILNVI